VRSFLLGALSAVALALVACSGASGSNQDYGVVQSSLSRDTSPQVASSDLQTLASGNTTFAFDLYHQIAAGNATDDLFYSPYSVSIALAMTYAGASSSTATQMATALDFQLPASALNPAFDALDPQQGAPRPAAAPPAPGPPPAPLNGTGRITPRYVTSRRPNW
jgi:serpin B